MVETSQLEDAVRVTMGTCGDYRSQLMKILPPHLSKWAFLQWDSLSELGQPQKIITDVTLSYPNLIDIA